VRLSVSRSLRRPSRRAPPLFHVDFHVDDPGPEALAEASGAIDARVKGWPECVPDEPEAPDQIHVTTPEDLHGSERCGPCLPKARVGNAEGAAGAGGLG
jgi:hypothetical protein